MSHDLFLLVDLLKVLSSDWPAALLDERYGLPDRKCRVLFPLYLLPRYQNTSGLGSEVWVSRMATNFIRAESPSKAVQKPVRHSVQAQTCAELSAKEDLQRKISNNLSAKQNYANPPTGVKDANLAAARDDVTTGLAVAT
ncbi:hypothetical protein LAZ67_1002099 [Cordylochernes scorpioides]|uniref:Uncharacterized protein n=1 Tax=Cordylochernes scorpioides TaxID=51811 RepID=A0ABY6JVV8_9ARAC|nr:hypothetical protein LAZ67_1002099 [Cordylochernes scorpioides]